MAAEWTGSSAPSSVAIGYVVDDGPWGRRCGENLADLLYRRQPSDMHEVRPAAAVGGAEAPHWRGCGGQLEERIGPGALEPSGRRDAPVRNRGGLAEQVVDVPVWALVNAPVSTETCGEPAGPEGASGVKAPPFWHGDLSEPPYVERCILLESHEQRIGATRCIPDCRPPPIHLC